MNYYQKFDDDFRDLFLSQLRENEDFGAELWSALANVGWFHESDTNNTECGYPSFRFAGAVIGYMLCQSVDYLDLLDKGSAGVVSERIKNAMMSRGWRYEL